jgi:hypothetical protein
MTLGGELVAKLGPDCRPAGWDLLLPSVADTAADKRFAGLHNLGCRGMQKREEGPD